MSQPPVVREPGLIDYPQALELQHELLARRVAGEVPDTVILCQHPSVITVGRGRGAPAGARHPRTGAPIPVVEVGRGGQATWHGPGQLVGYPIVDLHPLGPDLHAFLRRLEQLIIATLERFDLPACRRPGLTGVWVAERKIASIGIAVRRWVSYHGFALNVEPDLEAFRAISPCGLDAGVMTSMQRELGERAPSLAEVQAEMRDLLTGGFLTALHP